MKTDKFIATSKMTESQYVELFRSHIDSGMLTLAYLKARYRYETSQGSYQEAHNEYLKTRAYQAQVETNKKYPV